MQTEQYSDAVVNMLELDRHRILFVRINHRTNSQEDHYKEETEGQLEQEPNKQEAGVDLKMGCVVKGATSTYKQEILLGVFQ